MFLDAEQERIVREAWSRGVPTQSCAVLAGVSVDRLLARLKDQLADLPRRGRGRGGRAQDDPAPEEIAIAAAEIRARWTEERWLGTKPTPP